MRITAVGSAVLAVALGAGTLAACGSGSHTVTVDSSLLANAYHATQAEKTADLTMAFDIRTASGADITERASGPYRFSPLAAQLQFSVGVGGQNIPMQADLVGTDIYVALPASATRVLGGKKWIMMSLASLLPSGSSTSIDPTQYLQLLASRADSVTKVGTEQVGGVSTTHYRAQMDLAKAAATASPALQQMLQAYTRAGGSSVVPVDVWLDSSGRPRQMALNETLTRAPTSAAASAFPMTTAITIDFSNYGVPVRVSAPPASQVSSMSLQQLLQLGQQAGGSG